MKKIKKSFFHILNGDPLMQNVVVVQIPQYKFKANIARNATCE